MIRTNYVVVLLTALVCSEGLHDYSHGVWLDSDNKMRMNWEHNKRNDNIVQSMSFEVIGKTRGWMAIGFNGNAGMAGADLIIMWTDENGRGQLVDAHALRNGYPVKDSSQDVTLESMSSNGTHITARFSRKLDTCDVNKGDDWVISDDTVRVLWALNNDRPRDFDSLTKHAAINRGARSIHMLYNQLEENFQDKMAREPRVQVLDFTIDNGPIPTSHHTLYWCKVFRVPKMSKKYLIGYDVILDPPSNRRFVHHFVLYKCPAKVAIAHGKSAPCYRDQKGAPSGYVYDENPMDECTSNVVAVWAYGGDGFAFPPDTALPMFAEDGESVFMLEMHYDNQDYVPNVVDNSGVRLFYTDQKRASESAMIIVGQPSFPSSIIIPPQLKSFVVTGYCPSRCTEQLPPSGMTIFAGFLHTHLIGKTIRVRHIRKGVELEPVMADEHYDFNYQSLEEFGKYVTVLPGDELLVECEYNSMSRQNVTLGGPSTIDEMCYAFFYAKPMNTGETGAAVCVSTPILQPFLKQLGVEEIRHHYKVDVVVRDATTGGNRTMDIRDFVSTIDWNRRDNNVETLVERLEKAHHYSNHFVNCMLNYDEASDAFEGDEPAMESFISGKPPEIKQAYEKRDQCGPNAQALRSAAGVAKISAAIIALTIFVKL